MRKRTLFIIIISLLFCGSNLLVWNAKSQTKPFTMGQILRAIASMNEAAETQKKLVHDKILRDVRQRGVDFPLTKENEKLLRDEGASDELIEAIRQKSPPLQTPTPTPKPTRTPTPVPTPNEDFYLQRGYEFQRKGEYDKAIADYTKGIEINPNYTVAFNNRASVYYLTGEYDKAIADYDRAIEINPKYAAAYSGRGTVYFSKRVYDRSYADYEKAISLDPNYANAYNGRALLFYTYGDFPKAITDYTKAIELNPRYAVAYNGRGTAYFANNEIDKAIADYRKALEINPNYKTAKDNLDIALKKKPQD